MSPNRLGPCLARATIPDERAVGQAADTAQQDASPTVIADPLACPL